MSSEAYASAPGPEDVRRQLERILSSPVFKTTPSLTRLLRYLVEKTLEGHGGDLKEYTIGVDVFDRKAFDPKSDSIVRKQAGRLRARLAAYYRQHTGEMVIALEKGHYVPTFLRPSNNAAAEGQKEMPEQGEPSNRVPSSRAVRRMVLASCAFVIALGLAIWVGVVSRRQSSRMPEPEPETVPLTSDPGSEYDASFSPDGRQVVYAAWDEKCSVLIRSVGDGHSSRLSSGKEMYFSPKWSPDGKWIALVRNAGKKVREALLIPVQGGTEKILTNMEGVWLAWTPDSKSIAVIDRTAPNDSLAVHLVSIDDASRRQLTNPPAGFWGDISCAFSRDGKELAVLRYSTKGKGDVYLLRADGTSPRRLTHDESWVTGIDWTPDDHNIIYAGVRSSNAGLWRIRVEDSRTSLPVLIPGTEGRSLSPSLARTPDDTGFRVAYQVESFHSHLWKWDVGRGRPARVAVSTRSDESPAISPDGKKIVFMSSRSGSHDLWMCESDGSKVVQLTFTKSMFTEEERWSPDGHRLVFTSRKGEIQPLYILDLNGGTPKQITEGTFDEGYPSWSNDARWIYFRSNRSGNPQIWKTLVDKQGEPTQVTRGGAVEGLESPDGKLIYFVRGPDELGLWSVSSDGGQESKVMGMSMVRMGYWGVVEDGIVFLDVARREGAPRVSLKRFQSKSGEVTSLGEFPNRNLFFHGFSVTRDRRSVVWNQVEKQDSDLMLIDHLR